MLTPLLFVSLACSPKTAPVTPAPESAPPAAVETEASPPVASDMALHFPKAIMVRDAVVRGDLQDAKQSLSWLADHSEPQGLPEDSQPFQQAFKQTAQEGSEAQDLQAAAMAVSELGQACANCHATFQGPAASTADLATMPVGDSTVAHMLRHNWAADRLWEGLIGPSDDAWTLGAQALAEVPVTLHEEKDPAFAEMATRIHTLGDQALTVPAEERARLYGELLGTCVSCHEFTRP